MLAVALAGSGSDSLVGEATHFLAQELLLLGQLEVHWRLALSLATKPFRGLTPA